MKDSWVLLIWSRAENHAFRLARISEHLQCLVTVSSDNDLIIAFFGSFGCSDDDVSVLPAYIDHGTIQVNLVPKPCGQGFDVFPGTLLDGQPLGLIVNIQEAVMMEETHKEPGGYLMPKAASLSLCMQINQTHEIKWV